MAFVPFTKDEQPTMAAFNEKFEQAIGQAIQQALADGVKIEAGSYVGTGTYGGSNPCSISVPSGAKLVLIFAQGNNTSTFGPSYVMIPLLGLTTTYTNGVFGQYSSTSFDPTKSFAKIENGVLFWYSTANEFSQVNASGRIVNYLIFS